MSNLIKMLNSDNVDWMFSKDAVTGDACIAGTKKGTVIEPTCGGFYRINKTNKMYSRSAPVWLDEPVTLKYGDYYLSRFISVEFNSFYELLSFTEHEGPGQMEGWFNEDSASAAVDLKSPGSLLAFLEGRRISRKARPLIKLGMSLYTLLESTSCLVGSQLQNESFDLSYLDVLVEDLYKTDGIPETFEQSQRDGISTVHVFEYYKDDAAAAAQTKLLLKQNFDTRIEVTQVVNTCEPAYQIWFKMNDETYFFGCEHSIFAY